MKAFKWKEGFKLLSESVILVIATFQGQLCHATPLRKELLVGNNGQRLQHVGLKYGVKGKGTPPYLQVGSD